MSSSQQTRTISVFAPSKVNLYLHVTGKQDNGYHTLDSLACFADIGDTIKIEEAPRFDFEVTGPMARQFCKLDLDPSPASGNLVVRAARSLAKVTEKDLDFKITLHKNLPLGGGIGGGSSDAAATLWALCEWWGLPKNEDFLNKIMITLGSDVPACFQSRAVIIRGIGEELLKPPSIPELFILMVHPGKPSDTAHIYKNFDNDFSQDINLPDQFDGIGHFIEVIKNTKNDLTESAIEYVPEIAFILDQIGQQKNSLLSRMSGSGSTCFGLFRHEEDCFNAAEQIIRENPLWWVRTGILNRPVRY